MNGNYIANRVVTLIYNCNSVRMAEFLGCLNELLTLIARNRYYSSLSGALAILNMIPCYCLDGQWALLAFMEYFLRRFIKSDSIRAVLYHLTLASGSSLLLINILYGLWNLKNEGVLSLVSQRLPT